MPRERLSMRKIKEVLRLKQTGLLYDKPKVPGMIKLKWTNKSSKFPMKIVDWNRRENPVGYPAGRRHAPYEPD